MAETVHPRRLARERALQFLYGLEFTQNGWAQALQGFWEISPTRKNVRDYADTLIEGICERQESLDTAIQSALEGWTLDRLGYIERILLRIALYEMRHGGVPGPIAINEAIELAKRFSDPETPRFINGVLDRLRREDANE